VFIVSVESLRARARLLVCGWRWRWNSAAMPPNHC